MVIYNKNDYLASDLIADFLEENEENSPPLLKL